ncbi:hypothetical protein VKT23_019304 [Stygiomarasmius scandens]|uniref:Prolyl 4-hydroxylase alpha subunit domain-containing protein n=1 Tax=Marasmiellus scandens TaxID=2682957 RepID=A0ABR1IPP1_9AGAR
MTDNTLRSVTEQIVSLLTQLPLATLKVLVPAAQLALAHKYLNAMSATQSLTAAQHLLSAMQAIAQPAPSTATGSVATSITTSGSSALRPNMAAALICPKCGADVLLPDPEKRWYTIICGTRVGTIAEAYTVGVSNGLRIWQPDEASARTLFLTSASKREVRSPSVNLQFINVMVTKKAGDIAQPVVLPANIQIEPLFKQAIHHEQVADESEPEEYDDRSPVQPATPQSISPTHSYRSLKRKRQKAKVYQQSGHLQSHNLDVALISSMPIDVSMKCEDLPLASGGYVGIEQNFCGRTVSRSPEWLEAHGFQRIRFSGAHSIPILDSRHRLIAIAEATELVQHYANKANFTLAEKRHKRGGEFGAEAAGISFGKGQKEPMQLGGKRQSLMNELIGHPCIEKIAIAQSASYAAFSPKNYQFYFDGMKNLLAKLPHLRPNFSHSVFACLTVNFGPRTRTFVHTDAKNTAHGMCAITALGDFNYKLGGHLILWDLKLFIEFPPGSTILIPSALLLHSNCPIDAHETRYSITQYTAGGIWRWLEDGGRTEGDINLHGTAEEQKELQERREGRREVMIDMFSTLKEI